MVTVGDGGGNAGSREQLMTVAGVHEGAADAVVTFYESARFYRLPRTSLGYEAALRTLRAAAATGTPLHVRLRAPNSDIIEAVQAGD
jgi:hypothetical protein